MKYGSIPPQVMCKITEFINRRNDAGTVYLFVGEPLLYKEEVMYFCEILKAKQFVITTNGTFLDETFIKWCIGRGVIINMSQQSVPNEMWTGKLFDVNLRLLLKYQPETLVQLVYTQNNLY